MRQSIFRSLVDTDCAACICHGMTLIEYMRLKKLKPITVADAIGRDITTVNRYMHGLRMPPLDVANSIVEWSGRKVTHADLVPPHVRARAKDLIS